MEEILASISRIIADDKTPGEAAAHPAGEPKSEVLELTEAVAEDGSVRRITPRAPDAVERAEPSAGTERIAPAFAGRVEPAPPRLAAPDPGAPAPEPRLDPKLDPGVREQVLSAAAAGAAAAALGRLAATPPAGGRPAEPERSTGGQTIEDIVRDALRPLLRSWLDAHLPALAERLAREEIARILHEAGLR